MLNYVKDYLMLDNYNRNRAKPFLIVVYRDSVIYGIVDYLSPP